MKGHPVPDWGQPCPACDAEAAAFEAQLGNPPEELVLRDHQGRTQVFRIPKHLRPRRKRRA